MNRIVLFLLLSASSFGNSQEKQSENIKYNFIKDSIFSNNTNEFRKFNVFLPEDYSESIIYPILYALDGESLFEPTIAISKTLMDYDIIPKSIIVGISNYNRNDDLNWDSETGKLNPKSLNFISS